MKHFLSWILAIVIGFVFTNTVTFALYRGAGWIEIKGAPTDAILEPGSIIVQSQEGYCINKTDENGYSNPGIGLSEDGYILSLGSSITRDSHNMMKNHYTTFLNEQLGGSSESLKVYNIGQDGATFDSMAKNFPAAVGEFENAKAITMEFCILGIDENDLSNGFTHNEWIPGALKNFNLSNSQKCKFWVKQYLPFVSFVMEKRLYDINFSLDGAFGIYKETTKTEDEKVSLNSYEQYYRDALSSMRNGFDGQIVLVYIPGVYLDNEGMQVNPNPEIELLLDIARGYDIDILDATDPFLKAYSEDYTFPLGFWNTSYGPGHMNAKGNRIIADELYKILEVK